MEHPVIEHLKDQSNESKLYEDLLDQVLKDQIDLARVTAAKVSVFKDMKFNLIKVLRENDKGGTNFEGTRNEEAKKKI